MKRIIVCGIVFLSCIPSLTGAIVVNTSASSHSGGVTSGAGETVVTDSSSASAEVKTIIRSGSGGGTADVQITTTQNGVTHTESKQYNVPAGKSIEIRAATSVGSVRSVEKARNSIIASTTGQILADVATATRAALPATQKSLVAWLSQAPQSVASLISRFFAVLWSGAW